jgi:DNA-binding transcriptional ArsR family regulator
MVTPEVKDPISKDIMRVLMERRDQNITQITESLRTKRGSASRRIVRERVKTMIEQGIVTPKGEGTVSTYSLSEEVLRKWSQLLGISI